MSISKRLIDLARAELNSLLDRAARAGDGDDDDREFRRSRGDGDFAGMSDSELAAEIERRRLAREEVDEVLGGKRPRPEAPPRRPPPRATPLSASTPSSRRRSPSSISKPCLFRISSISCAT